MRHESLHDVVQRELAAYRAQLEAEKQKSENRAQRRARLARERKHTGGRRRVKRA